MISIFHRTSTMSSQTLSQLINTKTNLINIILTTDDGNSIQFSINRLIYSKGCVSNELAQAVQSKDKSFDLKIPNELGLLLAQKQHNTIFKTFMIYLASGKLSFDPNKQFQIVFLLAGSFNARNFFHYLIDNNVKLPWEDLELRNTIIKQSLEQFDDLLNQQGKYNFIRWIYRKYPKSEWFKQVKLRLKNNVKFTEIFIGDFIQYLSHDRVFESEDLDQLIQIYEKIGMKKDDAKQKLKRRIPWDVVSAQFIDQNKIKLRFKDQEIRSILQKRLNKMNNKNEKQIDLQLIQLRGRKNNLKKSYQETKINIGSLKIRLLIAQSTGFRRICPSIQQKQYQNCQQLFNKKSSNLNDYCGQNTFDRQSVNRNMSPKQQLYTCTQQDSSSSKTNKKLMTNKLKHHEFNPGCQNANGVVLECGCTLCYICFKMIYIQLTQRWDELEDTNFRYEDFQQYKIKCYNCNQLLQLSDALAFNKAT